MVKLELSEEQVIELVRQLPPAGKRCALLTLAEDARVRREARVDFAEAQLRQLCTERGLKWDAMSEEDREAFVDDLVHEDRECMK